MSAEEALGLAPESTFGRRTLMFSFGATSTVAAISAINSAVHAQPVREYMLAQSSQTNPTVSMLGARYRPLTNDLTLKFTKNLQETVAALREKCGPNLAGYKFGGFVADPMDDGSNPWMKDPAQFRTDKGRFPEKEVESFEQALKENCAMTYNRKPGLMWPITFTIQNWDFGDDLSHLAIAKDASGAQQWHCYVFCK